MSNYETQMMKQIQLVLEQITKPAQQSHVSTVTITLADYELLQDFRKVARSYYVNCDCFSDSDKEPCSNCSKYKTLKEKEDK